MSANVQGQFTLTIGGQKWSIDGEPTCTPSQTTSAKVQDGAGRVVGNKEMQVVPSASFSVIMVGDKSLTKLIAAVTGDTTAIIDSGSTGQSFKLTGARSANTIAQNGHLAQVELHGDLGVWT